MNTVEAEIVNLPMKASDYDIRCAINHTDTLKLNPSDFKMVGFGH